MRAIHRMTQLLLLALAAYAAGAEPVHARGAGVQAAAHAVTVERGAPGAAATLDAAGDNGPLPFLGAGGNACGEGFAPIVRAARSWRAGARSEERSSATSADARSLTRARALAVSYLDYSLELFQRRAGIPTNHTTAPPPRDS